MQSITPNHITLLHFEALIVMLQRFKHFDYRFLIVCFCIASRTKKINMIYAAKRALFQKYVDYL